MISQLPFLLIGSSFILCFYPFNLYFITPLLFAFLIHFIERQNKIKKILLSGFIFSSFYFFISISWLHISLNQFGGINKFFSYSMILLLCLYLALYPTASILVYKIIRIKGLSNSIILFPVIWTTFEILRGTLFSGFPWLSIGYTQTSNTLFLGVLRIGGSYLGSLCLILLGVLIYKIFLSYRKDMPLWKNKYFLFFFISIIILFSLSKLSFSEKTNEKINFAIIQGNVDQNIKWTHINQSLILEKYLKLASKTKSTYIFLPETSFPLLRDKISKSYLDKYFENKNLKFLFFGAPEYESGNFYNTVFIKSHLNETKYQKIKLVPFGDYFPQNFFINWFSKIFKIPMSDFKSGEIVKNPFQIGNFKFAMSICYEDIFSYPLANQVKNADFILNFTNDAWWGESIGPDQHLQMAIMRAIEFEKPMIRSTNNGISAIINESGEVIKIANRDSIEIIESESYGTIGSTPFSIYGNKVIYLILLTFGIYIFSRKYFSVSQ